MDFRIYRNKNIYIKKYLIKIRLYFSRFGIVASIGDTVECDDVGCEFDALIGDECECDFVDWIDDDVDSIDDDNCGSLATDGGDWFVSIWLVIRVIRWTS